jgi:hypothetical protein
MDFDQVHVISRHNNPVPLKEVEALQTQIGVALPSGYVDFIRRFGEGEYCDLFYIHSPSTLLKRLPDFRSVWADYWFFEGSEHLLSQEEVQQSYLLGESKDGDEIVFYPPRSHELYMLPRHSEKIARVKPDFSDLHLWNADTPRLLSFSSRTGWQVLDFHSLEYDITQAGMLAQLQSTWSSDKVLIVHQEADPWSWLTVVFVMGLGARFQTHQDINVTRTFRQPNGVMATIQGNGQRWLAVRVDCDTEAIDGVHAFLRQLEAEGLCKWR